nr:MAG TPA: hypothetical protein [Caudoviricetes sp.]
MVRSSHPSFFSIAIYFCHSFKVLSDAFKLFLRLLKDLNAPFLSSAGSAF